MEAVEQHYDGLNGKIIKWTLENGNTNHDPSILAFLLGHDGTVHASLMNGQQYQARSFANWLEESISSYEREHPPTAVPFMRVKVTVSGETATCAPVADAREAGSPVLFYIGRDRADEDDRTQRKERKLARSFERKVLSSKRTAAESTGWTLARFDLSEESHTKYLAQFEITKAPALWLWLPDMEKPEPIKGSPSASSLKSLFRKHRPAEAGDADEAD